MNPIETLVTHALETLPDSLSKRKHLLRALAHIVNSKHPHQKMIFQLLASIDRHEAQQAKLFQRGKPGNADGDGHNGKRKGDGN